MTCKECYHYDACGGYSPTDLDKDVWDLCAKGKSDEIPDIEDRCSEFKDKSLIIELPCKVGDTVYFLFPPYKTIIPTKVENDTVTKVEWFSRTAVKSHFVVRTKRSYLFDANDFNKTVFLTREAAEKALKAKEGE